MSRHPILCAPSALRAFLSTLLTQGACLVLPGPEMPVPIPLNECVVINQKRLLWATCHTPYGPTRPCVGRLDFFGWNLLKDTKGGCVLQAEDGAELARIVPNSALELPVDRAFRLRTEQARHAERAATDASYARRWALRFKEANAALSRSESMSAPA
ncbi:hypothetical protein IMCC26134_09540 [Verrucomicrobia bacterium IMCC26134]|nr:hypothetical protein IMCC26134_09540 [Verrucomicrobia bacterium IMCC26134]